MIQQYPEIEKWLNEYMQLKADLDSRLPEGSMPLHRMPQFKGTFSNKIRNRRLFENSSIFIMVLAYILLTMIISMGYKYLYDKLLKIAKIK